MRDYTQLNGLALAYVGDAIYEVYIRDYLVATGLTRPNQLHKQATHYVSAKAQAFLMNEMLTAGILSEDEALFYRRGRNSKSHTSAKNADITTYRIATGFEALMGYLHLTKRQERLEELIDWCIKKVGDTNGK
ncbi:MULTISPECIES: Mini-ribonuclease 3 [Enterococcus]|jgi:ribonuclease-3 family protein|uniref:Mini-ribonuclease 3 n=1 Tax=Enterococcus dispar ATCC 51266 TaxID=1139219 RepID=S1P2D4_9ENTE|nr:Mini-ribonuclease 3 [Enterococcus dispar]EOT40161.1 ribonuclease III [Enterococcus dispar ATCC 51266]EOW86556.1 ribonuclease III [Enterococcus dispar ATCC 51266]MCU7357470.1 Mini-ribonuclease 3 [Enterococcus dispar]MDT2705945.1 Mini-ribonuclease 3 [Enterococcus dispar]WCG31972.1 Mini-ribonuclease 3 [Enterococcus dispar]